MYKLGPESIKALCNREGISDKSFAAIYAMYFHTEDQGFFFLNLGRVPL